MKPKRRKKGFVEDIAISDLFDLEEARADLERETDEKKRAALAKACRGLGEMKEALEGLSVGLKHIGPGKARTWTFRLDAWRTAELKRKRDLKRELEGDEEALAIVKKETTPSTRRASDTSSSDRSPPGW